MVSLRSRVVEAPATTLKSSTTDHSGHQSEDNQPRSVSQPGPDELSERSQLMTPANADVPSLPDVALASSEATKVAQSVSTGIDIDQGEPNHPGIEAAAEEHDMLNSANDMSDAPAATFSGG